MDIATLSIESKRKGMDLLATGDCLHSGWQEEIRKMDEIDEGTYELNGTRFIVNVEVEDNHRVHHVIFFPSLSAAIDFKERIRNKAVNLETDGRPNLHLDGEGIAGLAKDVDALIGPAHAFTPWTAMYAYHDSLKSCYGDLVNYVSFVELGLSADTSYADTIEELARLTFLTNSDAHSPYPVRLAREFNRMDLKDATFSEVKMGLLRQKGRKIVLNVGLPPQEGKYNESACIKCLKHYTIRESTMKKWRCSCGGRIKKGVRDRVKELAAYDKPKHPGHRPEYVHIIPLAEIISKALGHSSPYTKGVKTEWNKLIDEFGNEVTVLIDAPMKDIKKVVDYRISNAIQAFRRGDIIIHPGGGGEYGSVELPAGKRQKATTSKNKKEKQRSLMDF